MTVLVAASAFVLMRAPEWGRGEERFLLSEFEVRGNRVLTEEEVLALSGAEMGANLLDVRISMLEEAVAASPRVDRARARRVLPDRVVVTLDEKRPAALVAAGVDGLLEITEDGAVLPPAAQTAAVDLPVVTGAVGDVSVGTDSISTGLSEALATLSRAREVSEGLWMEISEVRIAPGSGLVIYTVADGAEIRVGSGALGSRDLERLWRVISDIRGRGLEAESIDLRFEDQVIVRFSQACGQHAGGGGLS
jgi:cell division protein FtsQ